MVPHFYDLGSGGMPLVPPTILLSACSLHIDPFLSNANTFLQSYILKNLGEVKEIQIIGWNSDYFSVMIMTSLTRYSSLSL